MPGKHGIRPRWTIDLTYQGQVHPRGENPIIPNDRLAQNLSLVHTRWDSRRLLKFPRFGMTVPVLCFDRGMRATGNQERPQIPRLPTVARENIAGVKTTVRE